MKFRGYYIFIWTRAYRENFESASVYLQIAFKLHEVIVKIMNLISHFFSFFKENISLSISYPPPSLTVGDIQK